MSTWWGVRDPHCFWLLVLCCWSCSNNQRCKWSPAAVVLSVIVVFCIQKVLTKQCGEVLEQERQLCSGLSDHCG